MIRADAERQLLNVRELSGGMSSKTTADLRRDYRLILLSEVVPEFRTTEQLRSMFELASECLTPGGQLVFNTFLARHGYVPDAAAREFAEQAYSNMFTWDEMSAAVDGLPLTLVSDDSVYEWGGRGGALAGGGVASHRLVRRVGDGPGRVRSAT